jgi:hypothetical protein
MKRSITVSEPFADIKRVPLFTPAGIQSSRYAIVLDPDGAHEEAGIVSKDYNLVENREVVAAAERILEEAHLEAEEGSLLFDGKRFRQRFVLSKATFDVSPGDTVALTLDVQNSYDGSTRFGIAFNLQRLVCSNGMVVDQMLGGFRFKHNMGHGSEFDLEVKQAVSRLSALSHNIHQIAPQFQEMTKRRLSLKGIQQTFRDLSLPKGVLADVVMELEGQRVLDVYNAYTHVLTRSQTFGSEQLNRCVTKYFLADGQRGGRHV